MLTREEARKLHEGIEVAILANPSSRPFLGVIQDYIKEMTEKPNAKVKLENIVKAIQLLAAGLEWFHSDDHPHRSLFCGVCDSVRRLDELLGMKDE